MSLELYVIVGAFIGFVLGTVAGRLLFRQSRLSHKSLFFNRRQLNKVYLKLSRRRLRQFSARVPYVYEVPEDQIEHNLNPARIGRTFRLR